MLDRIIQKQKALGLSDSEFADLLDVPRSTWERTRNHWLPLSLHVARSARRKFPDLDADLVDFARDGVA